jgi:hypothetical protein
VSLKSGPSEFEVRKKPADAVLIHKSDFSFGNTPQCQQAALGSRRSTEKIRKSQQTSRDTSIITQEVCSTERSPGVCGSKLGLDKGPADLLTLDLINAARVTVVMVDSAGILRCTEGKSS